MENTEGLKCNDDHWLVETEGEEFLRVIRQGVPIVGKYGNFWNGLVG